VAATAGAVFSRGSASLHGRDYTDAINLASRLERLNKRYGSSTIASNTIVDRAKEAFDFRPLDVVGAITRGKIERCEAIALSLGRKLQPISADGRFFKYENDHVRTCSGYRNGLLGFRRR
jgi:hypothetical protein